MELGDKVTDKLESGIMDNVRELPAETRRILNEASDRISEYYDISKQFAEENQLLVIAGAGLIAGLVGFFIGRASKTD